MIERHLCEKEIFLEAIEIASLEERAAYLVAACGGDRQLREEVEALLLAYNRPRRLFDSPDSLKPTDAHEPPTEEEGSLVGPYKLMEQIGEGGMGVVYVAEQSHPVRRKVALKVIKPGMDTRQVVARFEAERQALAMMEHPNIAKVHDGGTTESGRPYFVMELVRGLPITEYCDGERLSIRDRLELFVLVCRAVQHAHQKGIIHRDLKPSNILVALHDGVPVPKIIDFGVAKAIGGGLTEKTIYTAFTQLMGTPLYMSPEQVEMSGLDVDTRSDIYSLGVLLYELLTGTTPFDSEVLKKAAFDEIRRIIREDEPQKPSVRLSTLVETLTTTSVKRSSDPRRLDRSLRGELDWITMKALEKDRARRYETANDFAADVMRYLTDRPVQARAPSAGYRFRKFSRRNRAAITTATVLAAALILGTAVSIWQAILARRAERDALRGWAEESQQRKLVEQQRNRAVEAEKLAMKNEAMARKAEEKAKRSEADTQAFSDFLLSDVLAAARPAGLQGGLGVGVTVAQALEAAEANLEKRFVGRPLAEATARHAIGMTWRHLSKYEQAERHLRRAVRLCEQELGPDDPATLNARDSLGNVLTQMGHSADAIALHEGRLKQLRATLGPEHSAVLQSMHNLARSYQEAGRFELAMPLFESTLEAARRTLGPDDFGTLVSQQYVVNGYLSAGKLDLALPLCQENLERRKRTLGPDHPHTLFSMNQLAMVYQAMGKLNRALPLFEQALAGMQAKLGPDHHDTLICMGNLGAANLSAGRLAEALPLLEKTVQKRKAKLGPDHPAILNSMYHLARGYHEAAQLDRALALFEETLQRQTAKLGADNPETLFTMNGLAKTHLAMGKLGLSLPLFEQALAKMQAKLGSENANTLACMGNLGMAYRDSGRLGDVPPLLELALRKRREKLGPDHPNTLDSMSDLAGVYALMGQYEDSVSLLRECLVIREKTQPDDYATFNTKSLLGGSLLGQKKYAEAEPLLLSGYEGLKQREEKIPPIRKVCLREALDRVVQLYDAWGKKDKADEWRKKLQVAKSAKVVETK
jgi:serine/threonine protein kinase/tetratricopeptide (TPR) repeat protein